MRPSGDVDDSRPSRGDDSTFAVVLRTAAKHGSDVFDYLALLAWNRVVMSLVGGPARTTIDTLMTRQFHGFRLVWVWTYTAVVSSVSVAVVRWAVAARVRLGSEPTDPTRLASAVAGRARARRRRRRVHPHRPPPVPRLRPPPRRHLFHLRHHVGVGGGASRIPPLRDVRAGVLGRPRPLPPLRPRRLGRSTRTRPTPRPPPRRHRTHPAHTHGGRRRRARRERNRRRRARRGTRVLRVDPRRGVGRRDARAFFVAYGNPGDGATDAKAQLAGWSAAIVAILLRGGFIAWTARRIRFGDDDDGGPRIQRIKISAATSGLRARRSSNRRRRRAVGVETLVEVVALVLLGIARRGARGSPRVVATFTGDDGGASGARPTCWRARSRLPPASRSTPPRKPRGRAPRGRGAAARRRPRRCTRWHSPRSPSPPPPSGKRDARRRRRRARRGRRRGVRVRVQVRVRVRGRRARGYEPSCVRDVSYPERAKAHRRVGARRGTGWGVRGGVRVEHRVRARDGDDGHHQVAVDRRARRHARRGGGTRSRESG